MRSIKVKREELIAVMKTNRDEHRTTFLKAQTIYREKMVEELDRMLSDARAGNKIRRSISLPEPEDHTDDYDRVIAMMEMHTEPIVDLDEQEFERYVRDSWGWKAAWNQTTNSYVNS